MNLRLSHLLITLVAATGCASQQHLSDEVVWRDHDRRPIEKPKEYWSPLVWDGADKTVFRPVARALLVDTFGPAKNTNALEEVPNSSWYSNRMALVTLSPERVARASCDVPIDTSAMWNVRSGKVDGANPGFIIEDTSDGRRYLLKFDSEDQQERATAADVIGSKIYWAAGFSTPCNEVVFFDPKNLQLGSDATKKDHLGRKAPLVPDDIVHALRGAPRRGHLVRGSASLFLPGEPLGPFKYEGTRRDDPNDVIPHEDRRELRGSRILAMWLNHFDAREQNTMTSFIRDGDDGRGYVQHHILDWGDSFGSSWPSDAMTRRFGHSWYFDPPHVIADLLLLGAIVRPWERARTYPNEGSIFGYFDVANFEPRAWRNGYPNAAFARMDEIDAYWGAKIVSRFSDSHIRVLVEQAHFTDPRHARYLERTLIGRRDKIVHTYLRELSPLDSPKIVGRQFCVEDLLVSGGYVPIADSFYEVRHGSGRWGDVASVSDDGVVCVEQGRDALASIAMRVRRIDQLEPAREVRFSLRRFNASWNLVEIVR